MATFGQATEYTSYESTTALITQLSLTVSTCVICVVSFEALRRSKRLQILYTPRVLAKLYPISRAPSLKLFGWVRSTLNVSDDAILQRSGLDALMYIRLVKMAMTFCLVTGLVVPVIILPSNALLGRQPDSGQSSETEEGSGSSLTVVETLDQLSMLNVTAGSPVLYIHMVVTYLITILVCGLLFRNYSQYYVLLKRRLLFRFQERHASVRTIIIEGLPENLRNERRLMQFCQNLRVGDVEMVSLVRQNTSQIEAKIAKRTEYLKKLELAHMELAKKVWLNLVNQRSKRLQRMRASIADFATVLGRKSGKDGIDDIEQEKTNVVTCDPMAGGTQPAVDCPKSPIQAATTKSPESQPIFSESSEEVEDDPSGDFDYASDDNHDLVEDETRPQTLAQKFASGLQEVGYRLANGYRAINANNHWKVQNPSTQYPSYTRFTSPGIDPETAPVENGDRKCQAESPQKIILSDAFHTNSEPGLLIGGSGFGAGVLHSKPIRQLGAESEAGPAWIEPLPARFRRVVETVVSGTDNTSNEAILHPEPDSGTFCESPPETSEETNRLVSKGSASKLIQDNLVEGIAASKPADSSKDGEKCMTTFALAQFDGEKQRVKESFDIKIESIRKDISKFRWKDFLLTPAYRQFFSGCQPLYFRVRRVRMGKGENASRVPVQDEPQMVTGTSLSSSQRDPDLTIQAPKSISGDSPGPRSSPDLPQFLRHGFDKSQGNVRPKVDKYYSKLMYYDHQTRKLRKRFLDGDDVFFPPTDTAFVTFRYPMSAQICAQSVVFSDSHAKVSMAPEASDVVWENLGLSGHRRWSRRVTVTMVVLSLILFWSVPLQAVVALFLIDELSTWVPGLPQFITSQDIPEEGLTVTEWLGRSTLRVLLPTTVVSLALALLPHILIFLSKVQKFDSLSKVDKAVTTRYYKFGFFNLLVIYTLGHTIITSLIGIFVPNAFEPNPDGRSPTDTVSSNLTLVQGDVPQSAWMSHGSSPGPWQRAEADEVYVWRRSAEKDPAASSSSTGGRRREELSMLEAGDEPQEITASTFSQILSVISFGLMRSSSFYINYVLFQTIFFGLELTQVNWGILISMIISSRWFSQTLRELRAQRVPWRFAFYYYYPAHLLIFVIIMTYSVINPLVIFSGLLYYSFGYLVSKHQLAFCYEPGYEDMGRLWHTFFEWLIFGLLFFQVVMIGALVFKQAFVAGALILVLIPGTWWFKLYVASRFRPSLFRYLPLDMQMKELRHPDGNVNYDLLFNASQQSRHMGAGEDGPTRNRSLQHDFSASEQVGVHKSRRPVDHAAQRPPEWEQVSDACSTHMTSRMSTGEPRQTVLEARIAGTHTHPKPQSHEDILSAGTILGCPVESPVNISNIAMETNRAELQESEMPTLPLGSTRTDEPCPQHGQSHSSSFGPSSLAPNASGHRVPNHRGGEGSCPCQTTRASQNHGSMGRGPQQRPGPRSGTDADTAPPRHVPLDIYRRAKQYDPDHDELGPDEPSILHPQNYFHPSIWVPLPRKLYLPTGASLVEYIVNSPYKSLTGIPREDTETLDSYALTKR